MHFGFLDSACARRVTKTESATDTAQAGAVISGRNWVCARCPRQRRRRPAGARRTERNRGPRARRGWRGRRARGRRPCSGPPGSAPRPDPGGARAPAALCGSRRAQRRDAVLASGRGDGPARSVRISEVLSGPAGRLAPSKMRKDGSTPRPPSPGRTSRWGGYLCPTADRRIAAARLHCCVSAALRGLAVGATRLRLADAGGAGAGKCLRGSAQHAYVAGRALRRLLSGSKSSDLQRRSALRRRVSQSYYNSPTLRHSPTSRIRGLNLKGPGGRPRGRGKWRPQENKTQPTATASTGGKKVICGRNAQKCQKYSVGKCPSGARRNRSTGGLNRNYIALNVWWRAAASNLEERPKTAENGRVWRVFDAAGRRPAERKFITFYYW